MSEIWMWRRDLSWSPKSSGQRTMEQMDVTGFDVEASDGEIGTIDEATYDSGTSSIVVDTGFWIFGKRRELPAGVVQRVDADDRKVYVSCTKQQVKDAPDYDPNRASDYRDRLGDYYRF